MIEVARPWILILLVLCVVPLVWRRRHSSLRFSSFVVLPRDSLSRSLEVVERGLAVIFIAATVLASSGPRTKPQRAIHWTRGARLVFVLDQSASMFSPWSGEGGGGSRKLFVAKDAIRDFVQRRRGDQLALVGFGKSSILYTPLTSDHRRFLGTLPLLNTDLADTVIDGALVRALELLAGQESALASQAVILLSDGAGRMLDPERIAQMFRTTRVNLYWLVIEGGQTGGEGMDELMDGLGPRGRAFVVGEVNELPQALEAVGRLEGDLIKVERWTERRSWTRLGQMTALLALLGLGVFAFGERKAPGSQGAR